MSEKTPTHYSCRDDDEVINHKSIQEAVENYIDDLDAAHSDDAPETVTVFGFAPMDPPSKTYVKNLLSDALERISEEWDHPEINPETPKVIEDKLDEFAEVVSEHWPVSLLECVSHEEVKVSDYWPGA